ncbi:MAG: hypothetical protein MHMPM18_000488 [Marteilia pararefringens]
MDELDVDTIPREFIGVSYSYYQDVMNNSSMHQSKKLQSLANSIKDESFLKSNEISQIWHPDPSDTDSQCAERFIIAKFRALEIARGTLNLEDNIPATWFDDVIGYLIEEMFRSKTLAEVNAELSIEEKIESDLKEEINKQSKHLTPIADQLETLKACKEEISRLDELITQLNNTREKETNSVLDKNKLEDIFQNFNKWANCYEKLTLDHPHGFSDPYLFGNYRDMQHFLGSLIKLVRDHSDESSENSSKRTSSTLPGKCSKFYAFFEPGINFFESFRSRVKSFFEDLKIADRKLYDHYHVIYSYRQ